MTPGAGLAFRPSSDCGPARGAAATKLAAATAGATAGNGSSIPTTEDCSGPAWQQDVTLDVWGGGPEHLVMLVEGQ